MIYYCLISRYMGNHAAKTENDKSEIKMNVLIHHQRIKAIEADNKELRNRLDRLECKWDALMRRLEGLERHPEDEGWFD